MATNKREYFKVSRGVPLGLCVALLVFALFSVNIAKAQDDEEEEGHEEVAAAEEKLGDIKKDAKAKKGDAGKGGSKDKTPGGVGDKEKEKDKDKEKDKEKDKLPGADKAIGKLPGGGKGDGKGGDKGGAGSVDGIVGMFKSFIPGGKKP